MVKEALKSACPEIFGNGIFVKPANMVINSKLSLHIRLRVLQCYIHDPIMVLLDLNAGPFQQK